MKLTAYVIQVKLGILLRFATQKINKIQKHSWYYNVHKQCLYLLEHLQENCLKQYFYRSDLTRTSEWMIKIKIQWLIYFI